MGSIIVLEIFGDVLLMVGIAIVLLIKNGLAVGLFTGLATIIGLYLIKDLTLTDPTPN